MKNAVGKSLYTHTHPQKMEDALLFGRWRAMITAMMLLQFVDSMRSRQFGKKSMHTEQTMPVTENLNHLLASIFLSSFFFLLLERFKHFGDSFYLPPKKKRRRGKRYRPLWICMFIKRSQPNTFSVFPCKMLLMMILISLFSLSLSFFCFYSFWLHW